MGGYFECYTLLCYSTRLAEELKEKRKEEKDEQFWLSTISGLIKSTKVLMPQWWQEPRAHAQLNALPYCMHLLGKKSPVYDSTLSTD